MTISHPVPTYPGWETVRLIGRGSFGAVYEIRRDVLGLTEKAALKHISIPQNQSDVEELYSSGYDETSITAHYESYLADIVREYQLMAEMKGHTNVVNCDDIRYVQKDTGIGWDIYIKMELLTPMMKSLDRMADEKQVIKLGRDMASALVLCRNRSIIHRDIKPQNIFVSKDGDFKLGDFGIAKTVEKTSGGTKIGTYSYMAPEVYNNQPYGHEADIYSLGMVLYWLLNERRLPFYPAPPAVPMASDLERARQRRFRGEKLPPPMHGSEELKRIVLKCCAFDPKDRYHSAEDLLWELEALSAKPASERGTGTPEKKASSTVGTDKKSGTAARSASFLARGGASAAGGGVLLGSLAKKKAAPEPESAGLVSPEILGEGTTVDDLEEPAPLLPPTGKPEPETEGTVGAFHEKAWRHVPGKPLTRESPAHEAPFLKLDPFAPEENELPTVYGPPLAPENDFTARSWPIPAEEKKPEPAWNGEREDVTFREVTPSYEGKKPDSAPHGSAIGDRADRSEGKDSRSAALGKTLIAGLLILAGLGMLFLRWMRNGLSCFDLIRKAFDAIRDVGFLGAMGESDIALFSLATFLLLVTGVLGVILCLRGKRFAGVPFFAASLLLFGAVWNLCDFSIGYMSVGAWLCVAFALAAMIVMLLPGALTRRTPDRSRAAGGATTWLCPRCGAMCRAGALFCVSCGTKRARDE